VQLTESEFKIVAASKQVKAGDITFKVKNDGKLAHDVAIAGTSERTKLIPPGGTAELKVTLKPGTYELYCTVPGHKAAGMDLKITVAGSTKPTTTTTAPKPQATTVQVTETEFKIALASGNLKAGDITFQVKNAGKIPHDLAIAGTSDKTKLIPPDRTAELKVTLKAGKVELYCTVPGHKAAGMDLKVTVS